MDDGENGLPADAKGPASCDIRDRKRPYERNRGDCSWTPTSTANDTPMSRSPLDLESTLDMEEHGEAPAEAGSSEYGGQGDGHDDEWIGLGFGAALAREWGGG